MASTQPTLLRMLHIGLGEGEEFSVWILMLESLTLSAPHCSLGDLDSKYRHLLCLCCVGDIKDAGDQMRVTLVLDVFAVFAPSRTQFGCLGHILTIPPLSPMSLVWMH